MGSKMVGPIWMKLVEDRVQNVLVKEFFENFEI